MTGSYSEQLAETFHREFGREPLLSARAPGRVNLIGEHTDYNDGFVLPAAIDYQTWVLAAPRDDRRIRAVAKDFDHQRVEIALDQPMKKTAQAPWSNYLRGVLRALLGDGWVLTGADLLIAGQIPPGAGLSSSAALEMALIRALTGLSGEPVSPIRAAQLGQQAENDFVGCSCGIMDQLASALGEQGHALLVDCRSLEFQTIPIPAEWRLLIVESGVSRGLVGSEYNQRRAQCEAAVAHFKLMSMRDLSLEQLLSAEADMNPLAFRRARHVLTENARTLMACEALADADVGELSRIMAESHRSMREDFQITTPEIDTLVGILNRAGQGQAGVRMTGGGFGGCVIALAPSAIVPRLIAAVESEYCQATGCKPRFIPASASAGAFVEPF